jgi:hypothetical protein
VLTNAESICNLHRRLGRRRNLHNHVLRRTVELSPDRSVETWPELTMDGDVMSRGTRGDVRDALRRWLGEDVRAVDALSDQELEELRIALEAARKRQAAQLLAASEEALRQMPEPLRSSVGKIVRG